MLQGGQRAAPWGACPSLAAGLAAASAADAATAGTSASAAEAATTSLTSHANLSLYSGATLICGLLLASLCAARQQQPVLPVQSDAAAAAAAAAAPPPPSNCATRCVRWCDLYSMSHAVDERHSPTKRTTVLGGLFSLLAFSVIATYASYITVQWVEANTLTQRSLDTLTGGSWHSARALPWRTHSAALGLPTPSSLLLRITVDGEPSACGTPVAWAQAGLLSGAWRLHSQAECGGSGVAQHTLICPACQLTADASITLHFHWSCQSYLLEAASVLPYPAGDITYAAAPPAATAGQPGALLSTLEWRLTPVLAVLWDNVTASATSPGLSLGGLLAATPSTSAKGWQLADSKVYPGPPLRPLPAAGSSSSSSNGSSALVLQPAAAAVALKITLPLSSTYATTLLTQRVAFTQLVNNVVGLSGVVSLFAMLFAVFEASMAMVCSRRGGQQQQLAKLTAAPGVGGGWGGGEAAVAMVDNPLRLGSSGAGGEGGSGSWRWAQRQRHTWLAPAGGEHRARG